MKNPIGQFVFWAIVADIAVVVIALILNFATNWHEAVGVILWLVVFSPIAIAVTCLVLWANHKDS